MDWKDKLQIIGALIVTLAWFEYHHREDLSVIRQDIAAMDSRHREDMKAMDESWKSLREEDQERWKWLFERTDTKLDQLRGK